ncbi:MAG: DUF4919 domain-containing protein [Muribaculaceae bacterium]|jgi:hypothetical protein|nr:DUF4919 domain-containing protein [Muribaculaceae bacterium]MBR6947212.1 DUF4919 domain-containing protein [Muribaculaceae bacterium]
MRYIVTIITALILAWASVATAQNRQEVPERNPQSKFAIKKVDFDHVREVITNPKNAYYYPKLMKAYTSYSDTTMSIEAWRNFYYGYTFQEDYDPFRESVYSNKVEELYYKQPHSRAECDTIEHYAELSLNDNMFDMNQMNFYIYVLKEKKKHARAAMWQYRLDRLIAAIMSSGRGTKEEPWVVITPEHEYNIINFLGFVATDHETLDGGIDYIKVQPVAGKSAEGFYFDISRMMQIAALKFPDI